MEVSNGNYHRPAKETVVMNMSREWLAAIHWSWLQIISKVTVAMTDDTHTEGGRFQC